MMNAHVSMVIEHNNMQIYKTIPAHLMTHLKLDEARMLERSDGMFVVQCNREK